MFLCTCMPAYIQMWWYSCVISSTLNNLKIWVCFIFLFLKAIKLVKRFQPMCRFFYICTAVVVIGGTFSASYNSSCYPLGFYHVMSEEKGCCWSKKNKNKQQQRYNFQLKKGITMVHLFIPPSKDQMLFLLHVCVF